MSAAVEPENDPCQVGDRRFVRLFGKRMPLADRTFRKEVRKIPVQGGERDGSERLPDADHQVPARIP
ncbi:MAG: hypothetical protein ACXWWT_13355, partial [Candidatus Deferrimicrobiaceae bacterium]